MAEKKYNLDAIISKAIHRPAITARPELPPLYARTGNESETTIDANALKDPVWATKSQATYNSPTNVRRLFIGENKVYIQYYQPYISAGKSSGQYWIEFTYHGEDTIMSMIRDIETFGTRQQEALVNRSKLPDKPIAVKTGLGGISAHWKMSNIEEIYMTPALAYSSDVQTLIGQNAMQFIRLLKENVKGKMMRLNDPLIIFESANGANIKNIRTRFPRLRTVAFMTNIDSVMQQSGAKNLREGLPAALEDLAVTWYKHAHTTGLINNCCIVYSDVPFESKGPVLDFATRPGIYKFDNEILEQYALKYKEKALELGRIQRDGSNQGKKEEETPKEKGEFEKILDQSLETDGQAVVSASLQLTFSRVGTKAELDEAFKSFTAEGRIKYRQLLGR